MGRQSNLRRSGFTIVELIVVISVISIIAAIVIFSLGAWQRSLQVASVKSDLNAAAASLEKDRNFSSGYPLTLPSSFSPSSDVSITLTLAATSEFCLDGHSIKDTTVEYYFYSKTKDKGPLEGNCASRPDLTAPATPASVTIASSTATTTTPNWPSVSDAVSYIVQCASDPAFIYSPQQITTSQVVGIVSVTVSNLSPSSVFYCRVKAINTKGASAWSSSVSSETSPLTVPTGLSATLATSNKINYSWDAVSGATSYNLQRSTDPTFNTSVVTVNQVGIAGSSTGLATNTVYYYRVQAVLSPVSSSYSSAVAAQATCLSGFIAVPGSVTYGTSTFCVMKFEAKNVGGVATSQSSGTAWVSIDQPTAISTAAAACSGCHLISEAEWLTIAQNVLGVATNWSGGTVGSGYIYSGHNDSSPATVLAATSDDSDGYNGTGNTTGSNQRRTLTLTNGEVIWDLSGNVWEWTSGTSTTGQPGGSGYAYREWNAISTAGTITPILTPSNANASAAGWTTTHGIGILYSNSAETLSRSFVRGGYYGDTSNAGIFRMTFQYTSSLSATVVGFRAAR